jgi:predicted DNA-binding transcriptional regulator YafY
MANRSERLLVLMQALRRRRRPVTGQMLADELGISRRSLYRDIETLKSLGAVIDGEPGIGFQLRADLFLPPLMFSDEEVEALVLGLRTLIYGPDAEMSRTARDATAKIAAVLPEERRGEMDSVGLFAMPRAVEGEQDQRLARLRQALRDEVQVSLVYHDRKGGSSERIIYPLALGYYEDRQVLVAWCTLRKDYRRFRIDGMDGVALTGDRLPEPRRTLFHRWHTALNLPDLT